MWYRFKDKQPDDGRSIIWYDEYGIRFSRSWCSVNGNGLVLKDMDNWHPFWWRYTTPDDSPPQEIKVGDKFVSTYTNCVKVTIVGKYEDKYWCLVYDGDEELYSWTEKQLLKYYRPVDGTYRKVN